MGPKRTATNGIEIDHITLDGEKMILIGVFLCKLAYNVHQSSHNNANIYHF